MKNWIWIALILVGCQATTEESLNRFSDEGLVTIYQLQDERNTSELLRYLKAKKEDHRVTAALAFASLQDSLAIPYLSQMLQIDQDEAPRRAAAYALGQIGNSKALMALRPAFDSELSKVNQRYILEAIGKCGDSTTSKLFENVRYTDSLLLTGWSAGVFRLSRHQPISSNLTERMLSLLQEGSFDPVERYASEYLYTLYRRGLLPEDIQLDQLAREGRDPYVNQRLASVLDPSPAPLFFDTAWVSQFNRSSVYDQANRIQRTAHSSDEYTLFMQELFRAGDAHPVVINAVLEHMLQTDTTRYWQWVLFGLNSGDMALNSIACYGLHDLSLAPPLDGATRERVSAAIQHALSQTVLPQQAETYIDLRKAQEAIDGIPFEGYTPTYNHPINWDFVRSIPADQKVLIETNKGNIVLQCHVNDAPATVSNFLQLVDSGYFNGKFFHRVVPHFVIQGGCPRGDGWGSLDWTQRSEFSNYLTYTAGAAGIASSGKDTEGVQFFITHCPTPHLDGRYTLFATVSEGMNIVNAIGVGDTIVQVSRK